MEDMNTILLVGDRDNGNDRIDISLSYRPGKEAEIIEAFVCAAKDNVSFRQIIETTYRRVFDERKPDRLAGSIVS